MTDINQVPEASLDFRVDAEHKLKELFPEAVTDGKIDLEVLGTLLGGGGGLLPHVSDSVYFGRVKRKPSELPKLQQQQP